MSFPKGLAPGARLMPAQTYRRVALIDIARTLALIGMVAFHFRFDLVIFGVLPPSVTATPFFYWHARLVAGSFLFLAGLSLWLAHGSGIIWRAFWLREGKLIAAAALVSIATYLAMPVTWIFFGILHAIAFCSLLALPFLHLPALVTLGAGAAVMAASYHLPELVQWNHPGLRWIGLQTVPTPSMDLEPLIPWFGPLLLGVGTGQFLASLWPRLARPETPLSRALAWPGRHSLIIYLAHQPILMGLIWAWLQVT